MQIRNTIARSITTQCIRHCWITLIPEKKTGSCTETRLNSPRGKYSKQNGERRRKVNLSSDDIPGVSLSEEQIEKLTLIQLKFWLKSRRIN